MASSLAVPWLAAHVEIFPPSAAERDVLDGNLALARELGAQVVLTHARDIPSALVRIASEHQATLIVVGKPSKPGLMDRITQKRSLVDRLMAIGGTVDICVVPARTAGPPNDTLRRRPSPYGAWSEFLLAGGVVTAVTAVGLMLPESYYQSLGLIYLLGVILLSLRVGRGALLFAAVLGGSIWDYIFIPPHFKFQVTSLQDGLLVGTYFVVALVSGQFAARIRAQAVNERLREERATALFHLTRVLAEKQTFKDAIAAALRQANEIFSAETSLFLAAEPSGALAPHGGAAPPTDKEMAAAEWAFRNKQSAGRFTYMPLESSSTYVPLLYVDRSVGALGLTTATALTPAQRDLLEAFARQLAVIVEREYLRNASEKGKLLAESEKLHRALLDSVSHELRTPLAVITASLEHLDEAAGRGGLVGEMKTAARRLNRLVANLLDQTRLESGALRPKLEWCDPVDLVNAAIEDARDALAGRPLDVSVPEDLPLIRADFALTEQALANLLLNAALHTPPGTAISVGAGLDGTGSQAFITVADRGPGLAPAIRERLFMKFARGDAARAGGLGLGLSIARGFVMAQGGTIAAEDNPGGGARFAIYLPHAAAQPSLVE